LKINFTSAAISDFQGSLLSSKLTTLPTVIRSFRRQIRIWYHPATGWDG